MDKIIEQTEIETEKFKVEVPFNNEILVRARKKQKIVSANVMCFCAVFFAIITVMASQSSTAKPWVFAIFGFFIIVAIIVAIYCLCTTKPKQKDEDKTMNFHFYEDYFQINSINKTIDNEKKKVIKTCLYKKHPTKQFMAKVIESEDKFQIKIFTGTYNGMPQYQSYLIPKSVFNNDELSSFKSFLEQKVSPKYIVK